MAFVWELPSRRCTPLNPVKHMYLGKYVEISSLIRCHEQLSYAASHEHSARMMPGTESFVWSRLQLVLLLFLSSPFHILLHTKQERTTCIKDHNRAISDTPGLNNVTRKQGRNPKEENGSLPEFWTHAERIVLRKIRVKMGAIQYAQKVAMSWRARRRRNEPLISLEGGCEDGPLFGAAALPYLIETGSIITSWSSATAGTGPKMAASGCRERTE